MLSVANTADRLRLCEIDRGLQLSGSTPISTDLWIPGIEPSLWAPLDLLDLQISLPHQHRTRKEQRPECSEELRIAPTHFHFFNCDSLANEDVFGNPIGGWDRSRYCTIERRKLGWRSCPGRIDIALWPH